MSTVMSTAALKAAMFNLGYLPRGDKSITTTPASTMLAIQKLFDRLADGGRIIIVVYHGHPGGKTERDVLMEQLSQWPQKEAQILKYQFINQKNDAPFLLCIEKKQTRLTPGVSFYLMRPIRNSWALRKRSIWY